MAKVSLYYGWVVLLALALTEMLALGSTTYAAGLFVLPLQDELGLSRAAASSPLSFLLIGATVAAPIVGWALDRYSIRWVLSTGGVLLGAALVALSLTSSLAVMVMLLLVPAAIGFIAIGTLTTGTLLSRWFFKRRGLALGIGAVATSGGGIFIVPWLSELIAHFGWRQALAVEGAMIAGACILLSVLVVRDRPTDLGLEEHAENVGRPRSELSASPLPARLRWPEALNTRSFWAIAIGLAIVSGISQVFVTVLPPYAMQLGENAASAARLILAFSLAAASTKILGGLLADFVNRRILIILSTLIIMFAALLLFAWPDYMALVGASILAGIALGLVLPSSSALVAELFGSPSFGVVMGCAYVVLGVAAIILPPLSGWIFDLTESYDNAFLFIAILSLLGTFATLQISKRA